MNQLELSSILFYADFLSLQETSTTVCDTCKYFFVFGVPMNVCMIAGVEPQYDVDNKYFQRAYKEYVILRDKFGQEGINSFLDGICNLKATGSVSAEQMLKYIHRFDTKKVRKRAFEKYYKSKENQTYKHIIQGLNGLEEHECSKYVAHAEQSERSSTEQEVARRS